MNTYRIQYTRPYISNDSVHSEIILACDEQQARDIFADCEVLSVTLDKRDYDRETESQKNAASIWAGNVHVTDGDMDAVHNFIVAAAAGDRAALAYGDADLRQSFEEFCNSPEEQAYRAKRAAEWKAWKEQHPNASPYRFGTSMWDGGNR